MPFTPSRYLHKLQGSTNSDKEKTWEIKEFLLKNGIVPLSPAHAILERRVSHPMTDKKQKNAYDDGDIPETDLPRDSVKNSHKTDYDNIEPLPESFRPRKDGPGGE